MRRALSSLGRGTLLAGLLAATVVAGLIVFTALGVGGDPGAPAPVATPGPHRHLSALQRYSQLIGRREGQQAGTGGIAPSEEPPIAPSRFRGPIDRYRRYAAGRTRRLATDVRRLQASLAASDRDAARSAWRAAFAHYLDLGAVYGAFGDLDAAIDGRSGGLRGGVRDPHFTGLHRLERGLWTGEPLERLRPVAARLAGDVARLPHAIRTDHVDPLDYALRAHEILEDAQRDFLSGADVPYSREGVLATASGVTATRVVMGTVRRLLAGRDAALPAELTLTQLNGTITAIRAAHRGRLPTLDGLRPAERERLQGSLGEALERLQMIPEALATQDPAAIPTISAR